MTAPVTFGPVNFGPATFGEAFAYGAERLSVAGVPEALLDARLLLAHATETDSQTPRLYPERQLSAEQARVYEKLLDRRQAREPLAHLVGRREFWSLDLQVTRDTLVPRPDTETLVEAALAEGLPTTAPSRILDLGTGSGCLLLALLSEWPEANGVGTDVDAATLAVAEANADRLDLGGRAEFVRADWTEGVEGVFDIVVSNPPYIETAAIDGLEPEVAHHDPRGALDGGADGLAAYRRIAEGLGGLMTLLGISVIEVGAGQADAVAQVMARAGLVERARRVDLGGHPRALVFARP